MRSRTHAAFSTRNRLGRAGKTMMLIASLALSGCRVGPRYVPPNFQAPPTFKEVAPERSSDGTLWTPALPQDATLRGNWWELYQEPELNDLEQKLNTSNQSIAQSFQNFMAARAVVRQARAAYYPTVSVGPAYNRARGSGTIAGQQNTNQTTGAGSGVTTSTANLNSNNFNLPFDVSWEPDVWGRVRNTVREYANAAQVSAADLANERLTEQAKLAQYYFEVRGQDSLIELYRQTIAAYEKNVDLTRIRSRTGIDTEQAVAQAQLNLNTARASAANLRIARAQYEHAIALLTGQAASAFALPARTLSVKLPAIPIGVPSQLLQRRPDIAAAERTMAEANALIGVETAAFYPTFTLGGTIGLQSSTIGSLFTWPSRYFSAGPSASETLFDAGLRRNTLAQYRAQYYADEAAYRQTVLTAFQQTEDYLASVHWLGDQRREQQDVITAAQRYYDLSSIRFRTGVDTYLNVFTAQTSLLSSQQTAINLQVLQLTGSVQLIEALGGGWDVSQLPSEKTVASK